MDTSGLGFRCSLDIHHDLLFDLFGFALAQNGKQKSAFGHVFFAIYFECAVESCVLLLPQRRAWHGHHCITDRVGLVVHGVLPRSTQMDEYTHFTLRHLARDCQFTEWLCALDELMFRN